MTKTRSIVLPLLVLLSCTGEITGDFSGGDGIGPGEEPHSAQTRIEGTYDIGSHFDLRESQGLPKVMEEVVIPLSEFSENPTGTILDLVAATPTPVGTIVGAIPGFVVSIFENKMNDLIIGKLYANVPIVERITGYADMLATILVEFEIVSRLEVGTADESGHAIARHSVTGFAFEFDGERIVVDAPELLSTLTTAEDIDIQVDRLDGGNEFLVGDHALQLPLGELAVFALNTAVAKTTDYDDFGSALSGMINCTAIAEGVGDLGCVLGACALNVGQIDGICEAGVGLVASQVEGRLRALDVAEIRMVGGQATLVAESKTDASSEFSTEVTAVRDGRWDATFSLGGTSVEVESRFEAHRVEE